MALTSVRTYIARSGASATATVGVALVAATAKTVVGCFGTAGTSLAISRFRISFASVVATDAPALVEVGITSAAGTPGTAFTPVKVTGSTMPATASAGYNYTVEPTYNRIFDSFYVPVYMGHLTDWVPLGFEPQADPSQGFGIRITSPAAATCLASIYFSE